MVLDFTGKQIVVTGASAGIGFAAAQAFCRSGATVHLCARGEERLSQALEQLKGLPGTSFGYLCDVGDPDQFRRTAEEIRLRAGKVDVWVNNAGGMHRSKLLDEKLEDFTQMLQTNAVSVLLGCQLACSMMGEGGVIINAGSYSGKTPSVGQGAYSASKAVVHSITATLASELAPRGIRVVGYAPGSIHTSMTTPAALQDQAGLNRITSHRFGKPEEVAALILFLASDVSAYINGCCISIDGGKLVTQAPENGWK